MSTEHMHRSMHTSIYSKRTCLLSNKFKTLTNYEKNCSMFGLER